VKHTNKTLATIVFHASVDDKEARKAITKLARAHGGKFSYNSFWNAHQRVWHSEATFGRAAYKAVVPVTQYRAAVKAARALTIAGLTHTHHWAHFGSLK
jgi:hypothetical protein